MPDKKITQQSEHVTPILGVDVLPIVANVAASPTNYKVQIKNFFSQVQIDLPATSFSAMKMTAFATANALTATQAAGEFNMLANSSIQVTAQDRYGIIGTNKIQNSNTTITGQFAAAFFTLDPGNSNVAAANTYGVIISHNLDANVAAARAVQPRAYLAIQENAGSNVAAKTKYFAELGAQSLSVSADTANTNTSVVFSKTTDRVATHTIKCCINGMDVWLLASNTGPA